MMYYNLCNHYSTDTQLDISSNATINTYTWNFFFSRDILSSHDSAKCCNNPDLSTIYKRAHSFMLWTTLPLIF